VTIKNDADADVIEIPTGTTNVTMAGTLGVVGVVTANAGVVVDEMTLDGDTLTATDDFIIDAVGDITLDADGGDIRFKDGGTHIGSIYNDSTNLVIYSKVNNADMKFIGVDGGSDITALQLDMSASGNATFSNSINLPDNGIAYFGTGQDLEVYHNGTHGFFNNTTGDTNLQGTGNVYVTASTDIYLNASGAEVFFQHGGTSIAKLQNSSGFVIESLVNNADMIFKGNDDGSASTVMLTLDASEAGAATFNGTLTIPSQLIHAGDTDTLFEFQGSNSMRFKAGGNEVVEMTGNIVTFNDGSADYDFRVETNGNAFAIFASGSSDFVSILTNDTNPAGNNEVGFCVGGVAAGCMSVHTTGTPHRLGRAQDGDVLQFFSAGGAEGSISISGTTCTFNGFSGTHESSGVSTDTAIGTVVSTIDELDVYHSSHKKAGQDRIDHAKVKVSDAVGDACVYGVVGRFNDDDKLFVTSVGIGSVRVTGACAKGDLLESNGDGTAKVQSDDIVRSKTLGKVTIGNSNTGVKLVSCVMYCG
jgi:hypothetical protein